MDDFFVHDGYECHVCCINGCLDGRGDSLHYRLVVDVKNLTTCIRFHLPRKEQGFHSLSSCYHISFTIKNSGMQLPPCPIAELRVGDIPLVE